MVINCLSKFLGSWSACLNVSRCPPHFHLPVSSKVLLFYCQWCVSLVCFIRACALPIISPPLFYTLFLLLHHVPSIFLSHCDRHLCVFKSLHFKCFQEWCLWLRLMLVSLSSDTLPINIRRLEFHLSFNQVVKNFKQYVNIYSIITKIKPYEKVKNLKSSYFQRAAIKFQLVFTIIRQ